MFTTALLRCSRALGRRRRRCRCRPTAVAGSVRCRSTARTTAPAQPCRKVGEDINVDNTGIEYHVRKDGKVHALSRFEYAQLGDRLLQPFLPHDYPHSVTRNYIDYTKWQAIASTFSSAIGVLSTQSLLVAVGVGSGAIPLAATLNWILKDGLGQLGGVFFASVVGNRFDAEPRRYRFVAAMALDAAFLIEISTVAFPHLFLPLASVANICKNVSWLASSASRAGIHRTLMRRENLADITAKASSQGTATSLVGTAFGIAVSTVIGTNMPNILTAFTALASLHLVVVYRSLASVVLNTLSVQKAERLALLFAAAPSAHRIDALISPSEMSSLEAFVLPHRSTLRKSSMKFGVRLDEVAPTTEALRELVSLYGPDSHYFLSVSKGTQVNIVHTSEAGQHDLVDSILQAVYIRNRIQNNCYQHSTLPESLAFVRAYGNEFYLGLISKGWDVNHVQVETNRRRIRLNRAAIAHMLHSSTCSGGAGRF